MFMFVYLILGGFFCYFFQTVDCQRIDFFFFLINRISKPAKRYGPEANVLSAPLLTDTVVKNRCEAPIEVVPF